MTLPLLVRDSALFLDIDGTLIEFVPRPEDARISEALQQTLDALRQSLDGALAVASGRALADVDRMFAPLKLAAAGQHGAEIRMTPGGRAQVFASSQTARRAVLSAGAPYLAAHPRLRVEDKGLSIAFHYRGAESDAPGLLKVLAAAVARQGNALQLLDGHLCYDVRSKAEHKGTVVERFMAAAPFEGRVPVYIGDAGTDEDGFVAVLNRQGRAILIGAARATRATERLDNPAALRDWLAGSVAAMNR